MTPGTAENEGARVRTGEEETADLSTALRSGRDDKVAAVQEPFSMEMSSNTRNNFFISTAAQRSGEICGFLFPGSGSKNLPYFIP